MGSMPRPEAVTRRWRNIGGDTVEGYRRMTGRFGPGERLRATHGLEGLGAADGPQAPGHQKPRTALGQRATVRAKLSPTDEGRPTHLAYRPSHAVELFGHRRGW